MAVFIALTAAGQDVNNSSLNNSIIHIGKLEVKFRFSISKLETLFPILFLYIFKNYNIYDII